MLSRVLNDEVKSNRGLRFFAPLWHTCALPTFHVHVIKVNIICYFPSLLIGNFRNAFYLPHTLNMMLDLHGI